MMLPHRPKMENDIFFFLKQSDESFQFHKAKTGHPIRFEHYITWPEQLLLPKRSTWWAKSSEDYIEHERKNAEVEDFQPSYKEYVEYSLNILHIQEYTRISRDSRCCCRWCLIIEIYLYSYDIFSVYVFMQPIKDVYDKWQAGSIQSIKTFKERMSAYYRIKIHFRSESEVITNIWWWFKVGFEQNNYIHFEM